MLRLIQIAQIVFCLVSMMLTSLFALSFSGVTTDGLLNQEDWERTAFLALLFVLLGCCIDIGKYLFWSQRHRSRGYAALSLILMGFSWLASCAFLVSSETNLLEQARIASAEYSAFQQRIETITDQIAHYEDLLDKRLASSYHNQWAEGQSNADKIAELRGTLAGLIETSSSKGEVAAQKRVSSTLFFNYISQTLGVSIELVRALGYGLLSLLLEVSTLGIISLVRAIKQEAAIDHHCNESAEIEPVNAKSEVQDVKIQQTIAQLTEDILKGRTLPVLRRIRAAGYALEIDVIRQVLSGLYDVGILEADKRNSYKLSESIQYLTKGKKKFAQ